MMHGRCWQHSRCWAYWLCHSRGKPRKPAVSGRMIVRTCRVDGHQRTCARPRFRAGARDNHVRTVHAPIWIKRQRYKRQRHSCSLPSRARARWRRFQEALTQTDLHRPAGWRCGCWPTSTFLFGGIVVRRFGGDDGARAIGADADVGFAWSGGGDGAGAGRGQGGKGSSPILPNSAAPTVEALSLARAALRRPRH